MLSPEILKLVEKQSVSVRQETAASVSSASEYWKESTADTRVSFTVAYSEFLTSIALPSGTATEPPGCEHLSDSFRTKNVQSSRAAGAPRKPQGLRTNPLAHESLGEESLEISLDS